jgi:hypothetical protein
MVVHLVARFLGGAAYTVCGVYADAITTDFEAVTCSKCVMYLSSRAREKIIRKMMEE